MTTDRGQLGVAKPKIAAAVVGVLVASLVGAFAFGAIGAPSVAGVENRFGDVTDETTVVHTDLVVDNPNPIGVQLGDTEIDYTVRMNEIPMAAGGAVGLDVGTGTSVQQFTTETDNGRIPPWWRSHVNNDERTAVSIDATVRTSILGEREFDVARQRDIETDIIGQFNSNETRPVEAENPPPTASNPLLYVNRTGADWGRATERETPIDMQFEMFNPQLEPYVVTELGYEITMNEVQVGEGRSEDAYVIPGGGSETLETRTLVRNQRLDDWWVTHLENDQVTELRIEFSVLAELPTGNAIRVSLDELTYEETIETDIFGTKNRSGADGASGGATPEENATPTPEENARPSSTPTPTPADGSTPGSTPTPTATDAGISL